MALVKAPRPLLLQQAAADCLHPVPRNFAFWRYRLRHSFFCARYRRPLERACVAIFCQNRQCPRRILSVFDYYRDSASFRRHDPDDRRPALGSVLDRRHGLRLARSAAECADALLVMDRALDGLRISQQIQLSTVVLGYFFHPLGASAKIFANPRPVPGFADQRDLLASGAALESSARLAQPCGTSPKMLARAPNGLPSECSNSSDDSSAPNSVCSIQFSLSPWSGPPSPCGGAAVITLCCFIFSLWARRCSF